MDSFHSTWAPALYLGAGVLFILALRGLSSPATSRKGNRNGMIGMAIAVGTTIALLWNQLDTATWGIIIGGVAIGGTIGAVIAKRIAMTACLPQPGRPCCRPGCCRCAVRAYRLWNCGR